MRLDRFLATTRTPLRVFAGQCGVTTAAVSKWAHGLALPKPRHFRAIERATGGEVRAQDLVEACLEVEDEAAEAAPVARAAGGAPA